MASVALAAATGAAFVREIFTGTYASDMGPWTPDAGKAMRYRDRLHRSDLALLYNVSAEFAYSLDQRQLADRARIGGVFEHPRRHSGFRPDHRRSRVAERPRGRQEGAAGYAGACQHGRQARDCRRCAEDRRWCIVGSSLKVDGNTWNAVDPDRAAEFMRLARARREAS